jgi:crossover junction endodeoxyribonuclease RusA
VDFQFRMPRPKSHFRTGKHAGEIRSDAPLLHITKPDTTKLVRAAEDGATGILWADDSQICLQSASKLYSDRPGCQITITELK